MPRVSWINRRQLHFDARQHAPPCDSKRVCRSFRGPRFKAATIYFVPSCSGWLQESAENMCLVRGSNKSVRESGKSSSSIMQSNQLLWKLVKRRNAMSALCSCAPCWILALAGLNSGTGVDLGIFRGAADISPHPRPHAQRSKCETCVPLASNRVYLVRRAPLRPNSASPASCRGWLGVAGRKSQSSNRWHSAPAGGSRALSSH
jgi:hypothetical protein